MIYISFIMSVIIAIIIIINEILTQKNKKIKELSIITIKKDKINKLLNDVIHNKNNETSYLHKIINDR